MSKTTHELAKELLDLPDVSVGVELWCERENYEPVAVMTQYVPDDRAIIVQKWDGEGPEPGLSSDFYSTEVTWHNLGQIDRQPQAEQETIATVTEHGLDGKTIAQRRIFDYPPIT